MNQGGGFAAFPFHRLAGLSDQPSKATNARAGAILRQLGLREDKVQAVLKRSVKQAITPSCLCITPRRIDCYAEGGALHFT